MSQNYWFVLLRGSGFQPEEVKFRTQLSLVCMKFNSKHRLSGLIKHTKQSSLFFTCVVSLI